MSSAIAAQASIGSATRRERMEPASAAIATASPVAMSSSVPSSLIDSSAKMPVKAIIPLMRISA
jgi:hypothetical protein